MEMALCGLLFQGRVMKWGAPQTSLPVGGGEGVLLSLLLSLPYDCRRRDTRVGPEQCDLPLLNPFSEPEAMI